MEVTPVMHPEEISNTSSLFADLLSLNAVFTLGRNMFGLITNETCFTAKRVHVNHDRNMFILSMIKTTSQGSFDVSVVSVVNVVSQFEAVFSEQLVYRVNAMY